MSSISATFSLTFRASSLSLSSFSPASKALFFNSNNIAKPPRYRPGSCSVLNLITDPDSFQVGKLIGSYGFINITSYSGLQSGMDAQISTQDIGRLKVQDVGEGNVKIRLYEGRIAQGPLRGTPVIFKVYPGQQVGGVEADMMAANELNAHAYLQSSPKDICQNIQTLLGGFETKTGEQWLAFRNDGVYSAADYAKIMSERMLKFRDQGPQNFWNPYERDQTIKRRRYFVVKLLQGAMRGLAYLHNHDRLHQSLGPSSIVMKYAFAPAELVTKLLIKIIDTFCLFPNHSTIIEREAAYLIPRLRDLAFSVDLRYSQLDDGSRTLSGGLWRRASSAGAITLLEKRKFGIADDIYEAGLLFAYLAFIPFSEAGIMDSLSLQRLLENTFKLDLEATREYCLADDRLLEAVKFLDLGDGAGWELLQAMLDGDFRKRPTAEAVLNHRFWSGALL